MPMGIDHLRNSGRSTHKHPAAVFAGANAEQLRVLVVLAGGPRFGVHDGHDEHFRTGGSHPAGNTFVIAIETNRRADLSMSGLHR